MRLLNAIGIQPMPDMPMPRVAWLDEWAITRGLIPAWDITPEHMGKVASTVTEAGPRFIDLEGGKGGPAGFLRMDPAVDSHAVISATIERVRGWLVAAEAESARAALWRFWGFPQWPDWYATAKQRTTNARTLDQLVFMWTGGSCMGLYRFDDDPAYEYARIPNLMAAMAWQGTTSIVYSPLRADGSPVPEALFANDLAWFDANLREDDELVIWHPFFGGDGRPIAFDNTWPWVGILSDFAVNHPWPVPVVPVVATA